MSAHVCDVCGCWTDPLPSQRAPFGEHTCSRGDACTGCPTNAQRRAIVKRRQRPTPAQLTHLGVIVRRSRHGERPVEVAIRRGGVGSPNTTNRLIDKRWLTVECAYPLTVRPTAAAVELIRKGESR